MPGRLAYKRLCEKKPMPTRSDEPTIDGVLTVERTSNVPPEDPIDHSNGARHQLIMENQTYEEEDEEADHAVSRQLPREWKPLPVFSIPNSRLHCDDLLGLTQGTVERRGSTITFSLHSSTGELPPLLVAKKQWGSKYYIYDASSKNSTKEECIGKFGKFYKTSVCTGYSLSQVDKSSKTEMQVASIIYELPTVMQVLIRPPPRMAHVAIYSSEAKDQMDRPNLLKDSVKACISANGFLAHICSKQPGLCVFEHKRPYRKSDGRFGLDFRGRGRRASPKNMQLTDLGSEDVLLQMAKWDTHRFHVDFKAPLNAFQAFGFALAQFDL